jgi:hypothetical protein
MTSPFASQALPDVRERNGQSVKKAAAHNLQFAAFSCRRRGDVK